MSLEQMRAAIEERYPGPKWRAKVKGMSDAQVLAVYNRLFLQSTKRSK